MVYCGKPSQSCRQCRTRNLKCDRRKDSCGQCVRAHLICPGYHKPSTITFRDETESVIRKACLQTPASPSRPLLASLEDRAKELFVSHYVRRDTPIFLYMQPYFGKPNHLPLVISVHAVSLAYFYSMHYSPDILHQARQRYCAALRLTNLALTSPQMAKDKATLLTVLLLDLFEKLTQRLVHNEGINESKHIDGALALVQLAGAEQFCDAVRVNLFHQVSLKILHRCLERSMEIPPDLLALRNFLENRGLEWDVEEVLIRLIVLRADAEKDEISEVEINKEAEELDMLLCRMCDGQTLAWKFRDAVMGTVLTGKFVPGICVSN